MLSGITSVLKALEDGEVRYLIVGGIAVVLHGHLRTTADLDLVIQLEPANLRVAVAALARLGLRPRAPVRLEQFADPAQREAWQRDKGLTVLSLWSPAQPGLEVDLFVSEPFDFDAVYRRSASVDLDTTSARVIGLDDLIALKRQVGRTQDLADVEALEELARGAGEGDD